LDDATLASPPFLEVANIPAPASRTDYSASLFFPILSLFGRILFPDPLI
jgi:hypothetical protein